MSANYDDATTRMGAVVYNGAACGERTVVGEGAVLWQGQKIPSACIATGVQARMPEKAMDETYKAEWARFKEGYVDLARKSAGWTPDRR